MQEIIDNILPIATICVALTNIYMFVKRPAVAIKHKSDENKRVENDELAKTITKSVMEKVEPLIAEVKTINLTQNEQIEKLRNGQLNLLRQQILYLYNHHNMDKTLTKDEMEQLHKLYNDYTDQGGNSFASQLYNEMCTWKIK